MGKAIKEKRNKHSSCDDITANYSDGKNCRAYRICFFFCTAAVHRDTSNII